MMLDVKIYIFQIGSECIIYAGMEKNCIRSYPVDIIIPELYFVFEFFVLHPPKKPVVVCHE